MKSVWRKEYPNFHRLSSDQGGGLLQQFYRTPGSRAGNRLECTGCYGQNGAAFLQRAQSGGSDNGGAIWIGSSYINIGQNTIYLQKFDVNDDRSNNLFSHQYMTNILAPYSESKSIYNGYKKSGLLETKMNFIIPVYNNMPNLATDNPNINKNEFIEENKRVYCNWNNVNVRTGPSTSYEIITAINQNYKMTRIAKGNQSGERWDMVILENGIVRIYLSNLCYRSPRS